MGDYLPLSRLHRRFCELSSSELYIIHSPALRVLPYTWSANRKFLMYLEGALRAKFLPSMCEMFWKAKCLLELPLLKCYPAHVVIEWGHKQWTYSVRLWNSRWNFHIDYYCRIFLVAMEIMNFLKNMHLHEKGRKYIYSFKWNAKSFGHIWLWTTTLYNQLQVNSLMAYFWVTMSLCETHNGHALPTPRCSFNMIVCWTKIHCCSQSSIQTSWVHFYFLKI